MYPKFGPGQLWEHVADQVRERGGEVLKGWTVDRVHCEGDAGDMALDAVHTRWGAAGRLRGSTSSPQCR